MKWKLWLNIATLVALGILVVIAWPDIATAFKQSKGLHIWAMLATIPLQFFFYFALAKFFFYFFEVVGSKVGLKTLFPAMMELNFVNHLFPSGGLSGFSYLTLRLKPLAVSTAKSTLSQLARFGFTFMVHIGLMLISLFLLALEDHASALVIFLVSGIVFALLFSTVVMIFIIGSKERIVWSSKVLARGINRLIHVVRPKHPETIKLAKVEETFLELHEDYLLMRANRAKTQQAVLWITLAVLAEMAVLYLIFVAHGVWINPGAVVIALVIANSAGLIAALPGGLGVYEPLMTAIFIAVGISPALAISVTLVFRILSLLLSLITGYLFYHKAVQKYGTADFQRQRPH